MTYKQLRTAALVTKFLAVMAIICVIEVSEIHADEISPGILVRPEPTLCVSLIRIRRTDIVDDNNILFYMNDGLIYQNQLPNRCPGLRINDSFSYRTSLTRLCNVDVITVLRNSAGGLTRGVSCGLGMFQPITEDEVVVLKAGTVEVDEDAVEAELEPVKPKSEESD